MTHRADPEPASRPSRPRRTHAEYRWTPAKAKAFLTALSRCGSVAQAARHVGMSRQSAYRLRDRLAGGAWDEAFELARRLGLAAQAERRRSLWAGPGLEALHGDGQGDAQGYTQGDAFARKVTGCAGAVSTVSTPSTGRAASGYASPR